MRLGFRTFLTAMAVLTGTVGVAPQAEATLVLDQNNYPGHVIPGTYHVGFDNGTFGRAQTFTVGVRGILAKIGVEFTTAGVTSDLRLLTTVGGVPTFTDLGDIHAISVGGGALTFYDLSSLNIPVTVGEILAFEPISTPLSAVVTSGYKGGQIYDFSLPHNQKDWGPGTPGLSFAFETFVLVPEPNSVAVLGVALLGVAFARRRRVA